MEEVEFKYQDAPVSALAGQIPDCALANRLHLSCQNGILDFKGLVALMDLGSPPEFGKWRGPTRALRATLASLQVAYH